MQLGVVAGWGVAAFVVVQELHHLWDPFFMAAMVTTFVTTSCFAAFAPPAAVSPFRCLCTATLFFLLFSTHDSLL